MSCSTLYNRYKKDCTGINVFETNIDQIKTSDTNVEILSKKVDDIMKEYTRTKRCLNGRIIYRDKCISKSKQDEGHDLQIRLLEKKLIQYEKQLSKYYKHINKLLSIKNKEIISPPKDKESPITNESVSPIIESKTTHRNQNDLLFDMGYDITDIPNDDSIVKDLYENHRRLVSLIKKRNIDEISLRAINNKYIYSYIVLYAIKHDEKELLVRLLPNIMYLISNGDNYAVKILDKIEKYFISTDSTNIFHIMYLHPGYEPYIDNNNNIHIGNIDIQTMAQKDNTRIMSLMLIASKSILETLDSDTIYNIMVNITTHFKRTLPIDERYSDILSILYKYIDPLLIIDKWLQTPSSTVRSAIITFLVKQIQYHIKYEHTDRMIELAEKVHNLKNINPLYGKFADMLSNLLLSLRVSLHLRK